MLDAFRMRIAAAGVLATTISACATAGSTLGSGVGDRLLELPPYYAGSRAVGAEQIAHLPIGYQRGAAQEPIFDPAGGSGTPIAALLTEMNAYLDSLNATVRINAATPLQGTPPDVQFGCEQTPDGECQSESREVSVQGKPWMKLAVGRPSASWVASLQRTLGNTEATHALVITLEVDQYWTHQRNLRGDKEVRLGSDYSVDVPWLTSLDQPVQVLQLTGALVDRDGRAVRIGAEGLLARRTNLLAASLGGQALIRDEDVQRLRSARRDDLPGQPLVWKAALRNLVAELTGKADL